MTARKGPGRHRWQAAPRRQALRFGGVLIGCTDTAFAMAVDHATCGGVMVTEGEVRALSNERKPDPASPGLNLDQLCDVAERLHVEFDNRTGQGWTELVDALDGNRAVVAQLWYAGIGGGPIGHAVYVQKIAGARARIVDPMTGAYSWIGARRLREAMQDFARRSGLSSGLRWGATRPTPWVSRKQGPQAR